MDEIIFKFKRFLVGWNGGGDSEGISTRFRPWTEHREGSG